MRCFAGLSLQACSTFCGRQTVETSSLDPSGYFEFAGTRSNHRPSPRSTARAPQSGGDGQLYQGAAIEEARCTSPVREYISSRSSGLRLVLFSWITATALWSAAESDPFWAWLQVKEVRQLQARGRAIPDTQQSVALPSAASGAQIIDRYTGRERW